MPRDGMTFSGILRCMYNSDSPPAENQPEEACSVAGQDGEGLMLPTIMKPTDEEIAWINMKIEAARSFIKTFSPDDAGKEVALPFLDRAFSAWMTTAPTDLQQINDVIDNVGIMLGQKMVDDLGLNWVITKDQKDIDFAVYGYPNKGDVLIYPLKLIAEKWERKEANSIENLYKSYEQEILLLFSRY